jgi:hypothetical protein
MAQEISFRMLFLTDTWPSAATKLPLSLATSLSYLLPHILRLALDCRRGFAQSGWIEHGRRLMVSGQLYLVVEASAPFL